MTRESSLNLMLAYLAAVAGLLALLIIGTICYTAVAKDVPTDNAALNELRNWGGVVIGFFFGSFFNLFGDRLKRHPGESLRDAANPNK
jgi:hypothetical protein